MEDSVPRLAGRNFPALQWGLLIREFGGFQFDGEITTTGAAEEKMHRYS